MPGMVPVSLLALFSELVGQRSCSVRTAWGAWRMGDTSRGWWLAPFLGREGSLGVVPACASPGKDRSCRLGVAVQAARPLQPPWTDSGRWRSATAPVQSWLFRLTLGRVGAEARAAGAWGTVRGDYRELGYLVQWMASNYQAGRNEGVLQDKRPPGLPHWQAGELNL